VIAICKEKSIIGATANGVNGGRKARKYGGYGVLHLTFSKLVRLRLFGVNQAAREAFLPSRSGKQRWVFRTLCDAPGNQIGSAESKSVMVLPGVAE